MLMYYRAVAQHWDVFPQRPCQAGIRYKHQLKNMHNVQFRMTTSLARVTHVSQK